MLELIGDLVKLLIDGFKSGQRAADAESTKEQEVTALRLAERRIQTEIAIRTLPP